MGSGGWLPDPSGRHAWRWYDGTIWTDRVVAVDGSRVHDPVSGARPAARHVRPAIRYRPGAGLAVATGGLVIVALSLFVLKWVDADDGTFLKLSEAVRDAGGDGVDRVISTYAGFGGFVLFGLAAVWVLLAGVPIPATRGGATYHAIIGTVICGGAAVYQAAAITRLFRGPASPEIGAWLGVVGYFVIVVGMVIGTRRVEA